MTREELLSLADVEAKADSPEPSLHSEHVLIISMLDYMRLRSWLLDFIGNKEFRADQLEEMIAEETASERIVAMQGIVDCLRSEAQSGARIAEGLHSRWKPGRAPGDIGRDRLRELALRAQAEALK